MRNSVDMVLNDLPEELPVQPAFKNFEGGERRAEIWAVGGGKGGIGKSLLSTGLSITMAKRGKKVLLFDADLGGANLHTLLGIQPPARSITDFLDRRVSELNELIVPTGIPNLSLISGASDNLESANPKYAQKVRLLKKLRASAGDMLVLDVGAGTGYNALDFFNLATVGFIVALPEPTSIENAYRFLRGAMLRKLRNSANHDGFQKLLDKAHDTKGSNSALRHMDVIAQRAGEMDLRLGDLVKRVQEQFRPRLILNQVRDQEDLRLGYHLRSASQKMLGIDLRFQGAIPHDDTVWQAVRKRRPHVVEFPTSPAAGAMGRIVDLMRNENQLTMAF